MSKKCLKVKKKVSSDDVTDSGDGDKLVHLRKLIGQGCKYTIKESQQDRNKEKTI